MGDLIPLREFRGDPALSTNRLRYETRRSNRMPLKECKPGTAFNGFIGRTFDVSSPAWPKPLRVKEKRRRMQPSPTPPAIIRPTDQGERQSFQTMVAPASRADERRSDVLFITIDDQAYGVSPNFYSVIRTPLLDRIARRSPHRLASFWESFISRLRNNRHSRTFSISYRQKTQPHELPCTPPRCSAWLRSGGSSPVGPSVASRNPRLQSFEADKR